MKKTTNQTSVRGNADLPIPEQWCSQEWRDLSASKPLPGQFRIGSAFILARYAEGRLDLPDTDWHLSAGTNDYRVELVDAWLSILCGNYELDLLLLPAGFLVGDDEWDVQRAVSAISNLSQRHGATLLVGFDHFVHVCPVQLEEDWPHQHALFLFADGTRHTTEKQWFVCGGGGCPTTLVPAQIRQWSWEGIPVGVAVCHDIVGLVHGHSNCDAPALENSIQLLLNPRHVNTTGEEPVGWGRLAVTLRNKAVDFRCAIATSMLFRALAANSNAERFAYRFKPSNGEACHWRPIQQPYICAGSEVLAWFQILEL
jgi:hypothetical protein